MDSFSLVPDVEIENPYDNAKRDVLKAMESVRKLPENQQRQLAEDLFDAEMAAMLCRIMCNRM